MCEGEVSALDVLGITTTGDELLRTTVVLVVTGAMGDELSEVGAAHVVAELALVVVRVSDDEGAGAVECTDGEDDDDDVVECDAAELDRTEVELDDDVVEGGMKEDTDVLDGTSCCAADHAGALHSELEEVFKEGVV